MRVYLKELPQRSQCRSRIWAPDRIHRMQDRQVFIQEQEQIWSDLCEARCNELMGCPSPPKSFRSDSICVCRDHCDAPPMAKDHDPYHAQDGDWSVVVLTGFLCTPPFVCSVSHSVPLEDVCPISSRPRADDEHSSPGTAIQSKLRYRASAPCQE